MKFRLNCQTQFKIGIGKIFDREGKGFFHIEIEFSKVDLLNSLNEFGMLHYDLRTLKVNQNGLFFRTCDSEFIEFVLMAFITFNMTDETYVGHAWCKSKLTISLNFIMLLVRIYHFV